MSYFEILNKKIIKNPFKYYLLKIVPKGVKVSIELKNNLKYILRGRSADKTIFKEIWLKNLYNQFGVVVEDGDLVIDIGAHVGIFSTYASSLSKNGKIYSFEPLKENFKLLNFHKDLNNLNITTSNFGIDGEVGKKIFYVNNKNSGGNSLIEGKYKTKKIEIETIKLSDFCKKEKITKIDFLKIDCEGSEYSILENDEKFLSFTNKIIMETHPFEGKSVFKLIKILKDNGFTIQNESEIISDKVLNMVYASKITF